MRILHIVGAMNMGGTETMLMNVLRSIDTKQVEFHFLSFSDKEAYYDQEIEQLGGKVIHLNKTTSIKGFREVMRKYGPYDVVHSHTLFNCGISNLAAKLEKVPVRIAHAHTTLDNSDSFLRKSYIQLMRFLIKINSTHFLACSQSAANYLFGININQSFKYIYLPNMINYEALLNPDKDAILAFQKQYELENRFVIGHVGRMTEAKNHKFLINLIDRLKDIKKNAVLLLVGDGELKRDLKQVVRERKLEDYVIFTGTQSDVSSAFYNMDVFVFPSLFEGLGLVLLEAQLCGIPCVVSEAIQPEADLKTGMLTQLYLSDGIDRWCKEILSKNQEVGLDDKKQALSNQGYTKEQIINQLITIYQGDNK